MPPTTHQEILDAMPGHRRVYNIGIGGVSASSWSTEWAGSNGPVTPGAVPTAVQSLTLPTPATGKSLYLGRVGGGASSNAGGLHMFFDRLYHVTGMSGTVTTAQTANNGTISLPARAGNGDQCEIWLEWITATGATGVNVTVSYTNQAGTAGRISPSIAFPASPTASRALRVPLLAPDFGVRSVQSVTLSATTGTAGNFGVSIMKPLFFVVFGAEANYYIYDAVTLGLPLLDPATVLSMNVFNSSTSGGQTNSSLYVVEA